MELLPVPPVTGVLHSHCTCRKALGVGLKATSNGDVAASADRSHYTCNLLDGWDLFAGRRVVQRSAAHQPHRSFPQCLGESLGETSGITVPPQGVQSPGDHLRVEAIDALPPTSWLYGGTDT